MPNQLNPYRSSYRKVTENPMPVPSTVGRQGQELLLQVHSMKLNKKEHLTTTSYPARRTTAANFGHRGHIPIGAGPEGPTQPQEEGGGGVHEGTLGRALRPPGQHPGGAG